MGQELTCVFVQFTLLCPLVVLLVPEAMDDGDVSQARNDETLAVAAAATD